MSNSTSTTTAARASPLRVHRATREDLPHVRDMIQELAEYEGEPKGPRLQLADLERDGFECNPPWFFVLLAERGGELLGQAMCNRAYSSWTGRAFYLEDLYVRPAARRQGVAMRLLQHLCQMAVAEGVSRVDWHVLEHNAPAQALYARVGAVDMRRSEGRAALRLHAHHIRALATATATDAAAATADQQQPSAK